MGFPKKEFIDSQRERRVCNYISIIIMITIVPSIYLAYNIVKRAPLVLVKSSDQSRLSIAYIGLIPRQRPYQESVGWS